MINAHVPSNVTLDRFIRALFALVLACVALYFARTLLELHSSASRSYGLSKKALKPSYRNLRHLC